MCIVSVRCMHVWVGVRQLQQHGCRAGQRPAHHTWSAAENPAPHTCRSVPPDLTGAAHLGRSIPRPYLLPTYPYPAAYPYRTMSGSATLLSPLPPARVQSSPSLLPRYLYLFCTLPVLESRSTALHTGSCPSLPRVLKPFRSSLKQ